MDNHYLLLFHRKSSSGMISLGIRVTIPINLVKVLNLDKVVLDLISFICLVVILAKKCSHRREILLALRAE